MSDHLPKESVGDELHRGARAALSAIPFVGGAAMELFNRLLAPPLQRRRDAWLNKLAEHIAKLEQEGRINIEELQNNDEFISTVMQASQVAIRNHQQEKLDALRNAVLNTAIGQSPDDSKREMFLAMVDTFTVHHLRMLSFLAHPPKKIDPKKLNTDLITGHFSAVVQSVEAVFAELHGQQEFIQKVVSDLDRAGLILGDLTIRTVHGLTGMKNLTQFGTEFLYFISEPKGGGS